MRFSNAAMPGLVMLCLLSASGCRNNSIQLVDILIDVDRETFNPVLEPEVIKIEGNKLIPAEGGIATIGALVIKDGQTFKAEKDVLVRPFYRDYHQSLVLKLFMGMDGERVEKQENDPIFNREDPGSICTFEEALELVKKTDNLTRGIPKIIYLVQYNHQPAHQYGGLL